LEDNKAQHIQSRGCFGYAPTSRATGDVPDHSLVIDELW